MIEKSKFSALFLGIFIFACAFSVIARAQDTSTSLTEVDSQYVCMVTDKLFDKVQIPVEVEGKTYYGCCEMCKEKLQSSSESREAVDPVSGKTVDKSIAVIGAAPDGTVFYFESEENLTQFNPASVN